MDRDDEGGWIEMVITRLSQDGEEPEEIYYYSGATPALSDVQSVLEEAQQAVSRAVGG